MITLFISNSQQDLPLSLRKMRRVVLFLVDTLKISTNELSVHFVSEKKICQLHAQLFKDPSPTDCITLPIDPPGTQTVYHVLGEAFICPKTALLYAQARKHHPQTELYRYVIHCLLHLIGYTDKTPKERQRMRRKETLLLKKLLVKYPVG